MRRHVWEITGNHLLDTADEEFLRYLGAPEIAGACAEPARVVKRPECVDLVVRAETNGRHHEQPVGIDTTGLVTLGARDVHALIGAT